MKLVERVAVVIGVGGEGIGSAIALAAGRQGGYLVINDIDHTRLAAIEAKMSAAGIATETVVGDVRRAETASELVRRAKERFGRLNILVNVVGGGVGAPFESPTEQSWDETIGLNTKGSLLCTQAALEVMQAQHYGRIVFVGSMAYTGIAGQAAYSAATGTLVNLAKTLNLELAPRGITVNCVAPGFIDTPAAALMPAEMREQVVAQIPLGRPGTPDEVAAAVIFLASDEASYVSGEVLHVAGGRSKSVRVDMAQFATTTSTMPAASNRASRPRQS